MEDPKPIFEEKQACPFCHAATSTANYFCPNCGKELKDKPLSKSISKQIVIYFVSIFLPPFGFWYSWKYVRQKDADMRKIGIAATVLTVLSIAANLWALDALVKALGQSLGGVGNLGI